LKLLKNPLEGLKKEKMNNTQEEVEKLRVQMNNLEKKSLEIQEKNTVKPQPKKWWQLWK